MSLPNNLVSLRLHLYVILSVFSIILLGLTAGRISYTTHLPRGDPLNHGVDFFDPSVVELIVCSILLIILAPFYAWVIYNEREYRHASRIYVEIALLSIIWFLLIIGTGIATSVWPNLNFCIQFSACQILQAMLAFAWLSWLVLSALIVTSVVYAVRNNAWRRHIHGWETSDSRRDTRIMSAYGPRISGVHDREV